MKRPADLPHGGFEFVEVKASGRHFWRLWGPGREAELMHTSKAYRTAAGARRNAERFVRIVEECGAVQLNVLPLGPMPKRSIALDAPPGGVH